MNPRLLLFSHSFSHSIFFLGIAALSVVSASADLVTYRYDGSTDNGDSTISAWFSFDSTAILDRGAAFYEITAHSFIVTGSQPAMNGNYDEIIGGGIGFASTIPGAANLPVIQSLVMHNSQSLNFIMSDNYGDPDIFVGGTVGIGPPVYSGHWTFVSVPEPGPFAIAIAGLVVFATMKIRVARR